MSLVVYPLTKVGTVVLSHTPREVDDTIQSLDLDPISCKSRSVRILILHPCFQVFANFRSVPFSATAVCCNKEKIFKDASIEVVHILLFDLSERVISLLCDVVNGQ